MDNNPKAQVIERLREAQNILVTVSNNPSVDQLSAAIGFTLMMNKLNKHATAVFSGNVPSTLEFLKPEETLEPTTDSLRDFIISLDKSKADKLRYKVEEDVVRIFITPYKTHLTENDLEFSQGDFNVDVVVALGVDQREHIDAAIMAHGRILHDATVIGIMAGETPIDVGGINWQDPNASSLCEMLVGTSESFQKGLLDTQMATAFLTGIVAETDRFSNDKTSPKVMTMSAQLMAAGANQQLIATKLVEEPEIVEDEYSFDELPAVQDDSGDEDLPPLAPMPTPPAPNNNEGTISLHDMPVVEAPEEPEPEEPEEPEMPILSEPAPAYEEPTDSKSQIDRIHIDTQGTLHSADEIAQAVNNVQLTSRDSNLNRGKVVQPLSQPETPTGGYISQPPVLGGTLTASTTDEAVQEQLEQSSDPLSNIPQSSFPEPNVPSPAVFGQATDGLPVFPTTSPAQPASFGTVPPVMGAPVLSQPTTNVDMGGTLADIENSVKQGASGDVQLPALDQDAARQAVMDATTGAFDSNRPGALAATGADYVPLNSEPEPKANMQSIDDDDDDDEPPEVPPPFPLPPTNGTMPLPS